MSKLTSYRGGTLLNQGSETRLIVVLRATINLVPGFAKVLRVGKECGWHISPCSALDFEWLWSKIVVATLNMDGMLIVLSCSFCCFIAIPQCDL